MLRGNQARISDEARVARVEEPKDRVERRGEKRHIALLRVALLHAGGTRDLCVVKNVSATGLAARVYRELASGEHVRIEFRSGELLSGSVVWQRDWNFGIVFPEPIEIESVLSSRWVTESGKRRNLPRIEVNCRGRLEKSFETHDVLLQDISQGGARVQIERLADPGNVVLSLPDLPPLAGVMRWASGTMAGISFNECIPFERLGRWIQAQRAGAVAAFRSGQ
jgi:PilZ domain-containing protein